MSHTCTVKAEYADLDALHRAVLAMGGSIVPGTAHKLYGSEEIGNAFQLHGWRYPIVVRADGTLAYDDFQGAWGKVSDLERLKAEYMVTVAQASAEALGWQTTRDESGLTIHHPSGGIILVNGETVDAAGFTGGICATAINALQLPLDRVDGKQSLGQVVCQCEVQE